MKKIISILFFVFFTSASFAQIILGFAENKYKNLNYTDAIPVYKYYINKKDSSNTEVIRKLANCYRLTNQSELAEPLYGKLTKSNPEWSDIVNYAEMLMMNKKYDVVFRYVNTPEIASKNEPRLLKIANSIQHINDLATADTGNIRISLLPFNSKESDFSPAFFGDGIIFSSTRLSADLVQRNHTWTDKNFTNLFISTASDNYKTTHKFAKKLKYKYNYGPATYNDRYRVLYYTLNNPKKKSKTGFKNLRILSATYNVEKNKWVKTNLFPFNSADYACTHPSINPEGSKLYFSSDMPGGYGGMDIYVCTWLDSLWSRPINLGSKVNTNGEELFPFVDRDSLLFFATDGRGGLGGLDVFSFNLKDTSSTPENLGSPINSYADDFGLIKYPNVDKGFFSSSRGNTGIDDDIYSYVRLKAKGKTVNVFVLDNSTGRLIDSSNLVVNSEVYKTPYQYFLANGKIFNLGVVSGKTFSFTASAKGYHTNSTQALMNSIDSIYVVKLIKEKVGCIVQGTITDKTTGVKLDSALVVITNTMNNTEVYKTFTDATGFYRFLGLNGGNTYKVEVTRKGYFSKEQSLSTLGNTCVTTKEREYDYLKDFALEPIIIGKAIKIENIYFDLNKYNIRADAAIELNKIVKLLNDNPDIIIELSSHTDARGSDASNMTLSDNRAKSSAAYIISNGIATERITGKGYGESKLVNRCLNNVKCTEKEHQQNRRTEFQVIGFLSDKK